MLRAVGSRLAQVALFMVVLGTLVPPLAAQDINGFLRAKGTGDFALSYSSDSYDEFYRGPDLVPTPAGLGTVDNQSVSAWFAYGLTDRLTLFGWLPWVESEGDGTGMMSQSGLQDISLIVAYEITTLGQTNQSKFIIGGGGRTPVTNYDADLPVSIGDGTTDGLIRFVYQFQRRDFYFSQQVGFDYRGGDAPNGFPLFTEVGYTFGRPTLSGFYATYFADGGTDIGDPGFTFPSNKEEYDRAGLKIYVRITHHFGIAVAGYTTFGGRNTGKSSGGSISFDYSF